jgi:hypothetical protein
MHSDGCHGLRPKRPKQKSQVCEANFFSGELALQQGSKDEVPHGNFGAFMSAFGQKQT